MTTANSLGQRVGCGFGFNFGPCVLAVFLALLFFLLLGLSQFKNVRKR